MCVHVDWQKFNNLLEEPTANSSTLKMEATQQQYPSFRIVLIDIKFLYSEYLSKVCEQTSYVLH